MALGRTVSRIPRSRRRSALLSTMKRRAKSNRIRPPTAAAEDPGLRQGQGREELAEVRAEIDRLVAEVASEVSRLPSLSLLVSAKTYNDFVYRGVKREVDVGPRQLHADRLIEYLQSMVAALPRATRQSEEITEESWDAMSRRVRVLFDKITAEFLPRFGLPWLFEADPRRSEDTWIQYELQALWLNVRGKRHYAHVPRHLQDLFLPHTEVLEDTYGLTSKEFVSSFETVFRSLVFGVRETLEDLDGLRQDVESASGRRVGGKGPLAQIQSLLAFESLIQERDWMRRLESVVGRLVGADLYDVGKLTDLPRDLLDDLSWSPGEAADFLDGAYGGWPLTVPPAFRRPLIALESGYYCFEPHLVFDHLYRAVQGAVARRRGGLPESWNRVQQGLSEGLSLENLRQLLPGAKTWSAVHYKAPAGRDGKSQWCETDGVLTFDDHLFVLECRAGAFTYTDPMTDFPAYVASLENLVKKPATQGQRFLDYLRSASSVELFDELHKPVGTLRASDFRCVTVCAVTLDSFTELAARAQHLGSIGLDFGGAPIWSLSLDDLRCFSDIFDDPIVFLHFVEQRRRSFESRIVELGDELGHVALYLKEGRYVDAMESRARNARRGTEDRLGFPGLLTDIDAFFSKRLEVPGLRCDLARPKPVAVEEIVRVLSACGKQGRARVGSFLLDLTGKSRQDLGEYVRSVPQGRATTHPVALSVRGTRDITVFRWRFPSVPPNRSLALEHARIVALVNGDRLRLLLELTYDEDGGLSNVEWEWIDAEAIPEPERTRLMAGAEGLRVKRIARARAAHGKIGRNARCPCGSGKKWKRCCLPREGDWSR